MEFEHLKNVATLSLQEEKCTGCGLCLQVCPRGVLAWKSNEKLIAIAKKDSCIECGACALNCPFGALTVEAGTGCAIAILNGLLKRTKPCC